MENRLSALTDRHGVARRLFLPGMVLVHVVLALLFFDFIVDDAFISLRYARNFTQGHGLVWNPGESSAVEGYSNFLWILVMAAIRAVSAVHTMTWIRLLGLLCGVGCVLLMPVVARAWGTRFLGTAVTTACLAAAPTFAFWSVAGLETSAYAVAVLLGVLCLRRWRSWYPVVLAVAALLRPEGSVVFTLLWAWRLTADVVEAGWATAIRRGFRDGLLFSALHLPYLGWRWWYYGSWVPNTIHAKFATLAGLEYYIWDLVQYFPAHLAALAWVVVAPRSSARTRLDRMPLLLLPVAMAASLVNCRPAIGYYFRFFWPVLPLVFVATGLVIDELRVRWGRVAAGVLGALLVAYPLVGVGAVRSTARRQSSILQRAHLPLAESIRVSRPDTTLLAISDCGLVPYVSGVRVLDMWGLNDLEIARDGFSTDRVLDRRPDLIVLVSRSTERYEPVFSWEQRLAASTRFRAEYDLARVYDAGAAPYHLWLFERERGQDPRLPPAQKTRRKP